MRQLVNTTLAYTVQELELGQSAEKRKTKLTVRSHDDKDDNGKSPLEVNAKEYQRDCDIDERRYDVEQNQLKSMVDSCPTIENAKDLASFAVRVE